MRFVTQSGIIRGLVISLTLLLVFGSSSLNAQCPPKTINSPFFTNFDNKGNALSDYPCWQTNNSGGDWQIHQAAGDDGGVWSSPNALMLDNYRPGDNVVSPEITNLGNGFIKLTFRLSLEDGASAGSSGSPFEVGVASDQSGSNYQVIQKFTWVSGTPNTSNYEINDNTGPNGEFGPNSKYSITFSNTSKIGNRKHIVLQSGDQGANFELAIDDIKIENTVPQTPPTANFSAPDTVFNGVPFCLTNLSQLAVDYNWYVNGQPYSSDKNINYTALNNGKLSISLAVSNPEGRDSIAKNIYVKSNATPVANFSASKNIVDPLEAVQLYDRSKNGPSSYSWSFSPNPGGLNVFYQSDVDPSCIGIPNSDSSNNPVVGFLDSGFYDVCLEASNSKGSDTECKQDYIIVRDIVENICSATSSSFGYGRLYDEGSDDSDYGNNVNCDFTINTCKRTVIKFDEFDLASGDYLRIYDGKDTTGEVLWDTAKFGQEGFTGSLSDLPPRVVSESGHVYIQFESDDENTAAGFNLNWLVQPKTFSQPNAAFAGPDTVCVGQEVNFRNTSKNTWADYSWDTTGSQGSGDVSDDNNLSMVFPYGGTWDINLKAENCGKSFDTTKQVYVRAPQNSANIQFTAEDTSTVIGEGISFNNASTNCVNYYRWEFSGDVTYLEGDAHSAEPRVAFNEEGCYDVTLHVGNSFDTSSITKQCYIDVECVPIVSNLNKDVGINSFSFADLTQTSKIGEQGYTTYFTSNQAAHVEQGGTYELNLSRNTSFNIMDVKVWIDLDGDNNFDLGSEEMRYGQSVKNQYNTQITIPDTVPPGDIRLRVGTNVAGLTMEPCGTQAYGEFEDYRLAVTPDQTAPKIILDGSDTVQLGACQTLNVSDANTYAEDAIDGRINQVNRIFMVDSSSGGLDSIRYEATDSKGNMGVRYRYVEVMADTVAPQAGLIGPDTIMTAVGHSYVDSGHTDATDNCSGVARVEVNDNVNTEKVGMYTYSYHVYDDAGNELTLTRYVEVVDTAKPTFSLDGANPYEVSLDSNFSDPGFSGLSDNYWSEGELDVSVNGTVFTQSLDTFTLTYRVTDGSGNARVKEREVIITDNMAPTVSTELNEGDTVEAPVNEPLMVGNEIAVTDNAGGMIEESIYGPFANILDNQDRPGSLGIYEGNWVFSDQSGNADTLTLHVHVIDEENPEISLIGPKTINLERWSTTSYATFDSGATATDNHYLTRTEVDTTSSYFTDYIEGGKGGGLYELRYEAEDSAGNVAVANRYVSIVQTSGIEESNNTAIELEVYPNPSEGKFRVNTEGLSGESGKLEVLNNTGKVVAEVAHGKLQKDTYFVDLKEKTSGIYYLKLNTENNVKTKQIVIAK